MSKKFFIAFKPKDKFFAWVSRVSKNANFLIPSSEQVVSYELLHITFHEPVLAEGDESFVRERFIEILNNICLNNEKSRIVISSFASFKNKIVLLVNPNFALAKIWVEARSLVWGEFGFLKPNNDDMLHVTILNQVEKSFLSKLYKQQPNFGCNQVEFEIEHLSLFEKSENGKWVEIERKSLMTERTERH